MADICPSFDRETGPDSSPISIIRKYGAYTEKELITMFRAHHVDILRDTHILLFDKVQQPRLQRIWWNWKPSFIHKEMKKTTTIPISLQLARKVRLLRDEEYRKIIKNIVIDSDEYLASSRHVDPFNIVAHLWEGKTRTYNLLQLISYWLAIRSVETPGGYQINRYTYNHNILPLLIQLSHIQKHDYIGTLYPYRFSPLSDNTLVSIVHLLPLSIKNLLQQYHKSKLYLFNRPSYPQCMNQLLSFSSFCNSRIKLLPAISSTSAVAISEKKYPTHTVSMIDSGPGILIRSPSGHAEIFDPMTPINSDKYTHLLTQLKDTKLFTHVSQASIHSHFDRLSGISAWKKSLIEHGYCAYFPHLYVLWKNCDPDIHSSTFADLFFGLPPELIFMIMKSITSAAIEKCFLLSSATKNTAIIHDIQLHECDNNGQSSLVSFTSPTASESSFQHTPKLLFHIITDIIHRGYWPHSPNGFLISEAAVNEILALSSSDGSEQPLDTLPSLFPSKEEEEEDIVIQIPREFRLQVLNDHYHLLHFLHLLLKSKKKNSTVFPCFPTIDRPVFLDASQQQSVLASMRQMLQRPGLLKFLPLLDSSPSLASHRKLHNNLKKFGVGKFAVSGNGR